LFIVSKFIYKDVQEQTIFLTTSLIGNTGNLGIPLGIAIFGETSVPYTSIINIANIFFIYTVGIYLFAKSKYTIKESLISMLKMPILWFALLALLYNYLQLPINGQIDKVLQMGAYATIVIQLVIFGIYLYETKIKSHNYKLTFGVSIVKLVILPISGLIVVVLFNIDSYIGSILVLSLATPLAVNNVNIAAIYECKPNDVALIVFISTIIFLLLIYFDLEIIKMIIN
jgi:predicted permease